MHFLKGADTTELSGAGEEMVEEEVGVAVGVGIEEETTIGIEVVVGRVSTKGDVSIGDTEENPEYDRKIYFYGI